jgi:hypothetical protein
MAVSQMIPLGHWAAPCCMYAFHLHGAVLVVTNSLVLVGLIWTTRYLQEKMTMALVEFNICYLGKHFYGTKQL